MTKDGVRRIVTSSGAALVDASFEFLSDSPLDSIFDPAFWASRGELVDVFAGRGAAWFIAVAPHQWVLRHYRRGGSLAGLLRDRYVWVGEESVRAFAEWRLLAQLVRQGLPVPQPIAARYQRKGLIYRCDLITQRISDARPLSEMLSSQPLSETLWHCIGSTIARLHAAGADHADLNAHNILLDSSGVVSVIDFDRSRLRSPGAWSLRNLSRLRRSLGKIARDLPQERFSVVAWDWLLAGYAARAT